MFKKTVLTLAFLTIFNTFYGFNDRSDASAAASSVLGATHSLLMEGDYVISAYDELMRTISEEEGHDWRLISAMAYHESRFRSHLVSPRGARGLMQVMPSVARQFGVPVELIADPQINVRLANQLLSSIVDALQMAENTPARDRMSIMLACYNSGLGHVRDARRLARRDGRNPDSWDTVLDYLSLKALPEYYESELVRCGRFTGCGMTQAYVDDVLEYYHEYCKRTGR